MAADLLEVQAQQEQRPEGACAGEEVGAIAYRDSAQPEDRQAQRCGAKRVGLVGGGNSAAQAAIWLARGGALVTLLHRRADLAETMSDYLISNLERYGVEMRGHSEIESLHGEHGELEAVTLRDGTRIGMRFLFCFLGAAPCTDWIGDAVARDIHGFLLTGEQAGATTSRAMSVPGTSRSATSAPDRPSAWPQPSATAPSRSARCTSTSAERLARLDAQRARRATPDDVDHVGGRRGVGQDPRPPLGIEHLGQATDALRGVPAQQRVEADRQLCPGIVTPGLRALAHAVLGSRRFNARRICGSTRSSSSGCDAR